MIMERWRNTWQLEMAIKSEYERSTKEQNIAFQISWALVDNDISQAQFALTVESILSFQKVRVLQSSKLNAHCQYTLIQVKVGQTWANSACE